MTEELIAEVFSDSRKVSRFLAQKDPLTILSKILGPSFDEYRLKWHLARSMQKIPAFPLHVDYELKRECDLRCPMCLARNPENISDLELSPKTVKDLIDLGAASGQASMGFGGLWEPLNSPDIPDLVAYGRSKGLVEAMFNTNGLRLSPSVSRELIKSGLTRIMISLDAATEETYKLMRPGSDFKLVENNIHQLLALKKALNSPLPLVRVSFCLTSLNETELDSFIERWREVVDFISLQYYGNFNTQKSHLWPKLGQVPPPSGKCAQPFKRLSILCDGTVLPCCDLSGLSFKIGSIYQNYPGSPFNLGNQDNQDNLGNLGNPGNPGNPIKLGNLGNLSDIWTGELMRDLRERHFKGGDELPKVCQRCQAKFQPDNF
ncbi:MAG: radical SAM protein [Deltaproteobacteria bacterium]|jgi:MoaA/NifB/PqqE/SkfB family radical SAM enzyme|nr:radical SAM protein [Deltaproteobacteria bacterium]